MSYTNINKGSLHFNTKLYAGTGSTNAITGVNFQPDLTWIKQRNGSTNNMLVDAVRGVTKTLVSNTTVAEDTDANSLTTFGTDGFTVGSTGAFNASGGANYVSWNWKANGAGSANTAGTINSTVSVNTTAGFSIVKYTGNGTAGATVGHGLGAIPKMIIIKGLTNTSAENWRVFHNSVSYGRLVLNDNDEVANSTDFGANGSGGTITQNINYFTIGDNARVNGSGDEFIAYCFAEKTGYSKFGSYMGNGNANGTFVYCGFKPAFVLKKNTTDAREWNMEDNKRAGFNPKNYSLFPHNSDAEQTGYERIDFLSNGFKLRTNSEHWNESGDTFIYAAFGQTIVGSNNVPATAR